MKAGDNDDSTYTRLKRYKCLSALDLGQGWLRAIEIEIENRNPRILDRQRKQFM